MPEATPPTRPPAPSATAQTRIRLADPAPRQVTAFDLRPDADARAALADALGISAIRKLAFTGHLVPSGRRDWTLEARLGATVVQPCIVTLAPVTTRIDEDVTRRYMHELPEPAPGESEMPEDEVEALPATLDLAEVMAEALALALPPWPRAADAGPVDLTVTEPGATPLDSEAARPFAGLAALRDKLGSGNDETP